MKHLLKAISILVTCTLLLAGCGGPQKQSEAAAETSGGGAPVATGRYVETEITPPAPDTGGGHGIPLSIIPHGDGSLDCFLLADAPNGPKENDGVTESLYHYYSPDGGATWEQKDPTGWLRQAAALCGMEGRLDEVAKPGEYLDKALVRSIDMDGDGNLFCTIYNEAGNYYHLIKAAADGSVKEIPVSGWQLEGLMPRSLSVTTDGSVGVVFDEGTAALYDGEIGTLQVEAREDYGVRFAWCDQPAAFSPGQIAVLDESGQLVLYNKGVPQALDLPQTGGAVAADWNDDLYIASHKGIFVLGKGMSVFETVMDGSLYQYSDPGRDIRGFRYEPETDTFYMILGTNTEDGAIQIYRYAYDADMPRKPDKQLNVVSLLESGTVRKAMLEFQMQHPDVAVNYTNTYTEDYTLDEEETEAAKAAAVQTLEEKFGGCDVAILDGLDVQAYIDGGKLADLGGIAELDGCLPIVQTWKQGGSLWAAPTRFTISMDAMKSYYDPGDTGIQQMHFLFKTLQNGQFALAEKEPFHQALTAGVRADSEQQALAKEFIACMLSDAVQELDYEDGLPVSAAAFDRQAAWAARWETPEGFEGIRQEIETRMNEK